MGCALIAALQEWDWTAVKVTPHRHEVVEKLPRIWLEADPSSEKDTGRYLAAGVRRAYLVTVSPEWSSEDAQELADLVGEASRTDAVLVESNRFARGAWSQSGVRLTVIGAPVEQWKASLRECVMAADALVLTNGMTAQDLPLEFQGRYLFVLRSGKWASPALVEFVRERLQSNLDSD